jgi:hypothetical protein
MPSNVGAVSQTRTSWFVLGKSNGRSTSTSSTLKMTAFAARPTARVATSSALRALCFHIPRRA